MGIRIAGIGGYVPERKLTNVELVTGLDTTDEWITAKTGIRERRICKDGEAPSDMGCQAALHCLRDADVDKSAVDLIVVASATPDQPQPAVACMVQDKLGIAEGNCPAFDVNSVCAGFVYALSVAQDMMLSAPKRYRNALVIGADAFSRILHWRDRSTCIFFGDGAGAVLLSQTDEDERRMHFLLGSDGSGRDYIKVPAGGSRMPVDSSVLEKHLNNFVMDGKKVWDFAVRTVPQSIRALLAEHELTPKDVDLLILHQSNLRMIERIVGDLGLSMEQTVTTVETYGNTAAASIPLTMQSAKQAGRFKRGSRVVLCGFGGGLSWGAALIQL